MSRIDKKTKLNKTLLLQKKRKSYGFGIRVNEWSEFSFFGEVALPFNATLYLRFFYAAVFPRTYLQTHRLSFHLTFSR